MNSSTFCQDYAACFIAKIIQNASKNVLSFIFHDCLVVLLEQDQDQPY